MSVNDYTSLFFLNGSIIDLKYYVSFKCTTMLFSYMCAFSGDFPV